MATKTAPPSTRGIVSSSSTFAGAATIPVDKPLTEMQVRFVKNVASGDTIKNAYVRAGYKLNETNSPGARSYLYRMLEMPNIKAALAREREAYIRQSDMTKKKVMDGLIESIEMAKLMSEPMTMISGWREVGKLCGFYEPTRHKVDISVNGTLVLEQMNALSDEELLKMIEGGATQALYPALEASIDQG